MKKYIFLIVNMVLVTLCFSQDFQKEGPVTLASNTVGVDPKKYEAGHPSLPMDTRLIVTNKKNNKKVVVRINHNITLIGGAIIALSQKTYDELGFDKNGGIVELELAEKDTPLGPYTEKEKPKPQEKPAEPKPGPTEGEKPDTKPPAANTSFPPSAKREGPAAWYGKELDNWPATSGELLDSTQYIAGYPSLDYNTLLVVTNKATNKKVIVRINDRPTLGGNRIIELAQKPFDELGLDRLDGGTVTLDIAEPGSKVGPVPDEPAPDPAPQSSTSTEPAPQTSQAPEPAQQTVQPETPAPEPEEPALPALAPVPESPSPPAVQAPQPTPEAPQATTPTAPQTAQPETTPSPIAQAPQPESPPQPPAVLPPVPLENFKIYPDNFRPIYGKTYRIQIAALKGSKAVKKAIQSLRNVGLIPYIEEKANPNDPLTRIVLPYVKAEDFVSVTEKIRQTGLFKEILCREEVSAN